MLEKLSPKSTGAPTMAAGQMRLSFNFNITFTNVTEIFYLQLFLHYIAVAQSTIRLEDQVFYMT